jgi:hypothetical protein
MSLALELKPPRPSAQAWMVRERWQPGYFPQFVVGRESLGTAALMTGMDAAYSDFRRLAEGA